MRSAAKTFETIRTCRICGDAGLRKFFDLGFQPLANSLPKSPLETEDFYPLSLSWCGNCGLVQLNETVDPKVLFSQYVWVTGTSRTANEFSKDFYKELVRRTEDPKSGYALEIASNDGTFLRPFLENGHDVLGIDPAANVARMAEAAGVPTRALFWGSTAAEDVLRERGPAKIVFARNVLPHVANTRDFVRSLSRVLADDGVLAIEAHYAKVILEELHYDSIYHEHLCYFTLKTLEKLLNDFGLFVFDLTKSPISGGSLVVYAKKGRGAESGVLGDYREKERRGKTNDFSSWQDFARRSFEHKEKLIVMLAAERKRGTITGWGASARSSTIANFCGIDARFLESVIDLNPLKQGRFTAGVHIPILPPERALAAQPRTVFIMAWNFAEEIMDMLRVKYRFRGACIVPFPKSPRVLTSRQ